MRENEIRVNTTRFGELQVGLNETIVFPDGILGFSDLQRYCLVDPADETLILWLQSLDNASVAFPVLEPKVFKEDYVARLSGQELKSLKLININQSIVFTILTIPKDISQMTANLKAPIIINLREQLGKQVVLQENEYTLKYLIFKELKAKLSVINAQRSSAVHENVERKASSLPINLRSMVPSSQVRQL